MIENGKKIDGSFSISIVENGEEKEVEFSKLLDKPTIVSVYMSNNSSSCDRQALSVTENAEWFRKQGYNIYTLSKDSVRSHKNYTKKHNIKHALISDPDQKFAKATDSIIEKNMFGRTFHDPSRSAFVIDSDGTILASIKKVRTKDHAEELKDLIRDLK